MRVILVNKTLLVSAVALAVSGNAMVSGNALAEAGVYGQIRLGLATYVPPTKPDDTSVCTGVSPPTCTTDSTGTPLGVDELTVRSGKLTFGAKGSNDLDNGMTFSYQLEMEHDAANTKQTGWANDKSWVAIGGDWGKLIAGRASDMAGFACGGTDILTNGTAEACSLSHSTETDNAIQYRGSAGALDFGIIFTADGSTDDDDILYGAKYSGSNWSVGAQIWEDESGNGGTGATLTQIGATLQLGDIGLGVTVVDADDDSTPDDGGVDFGLSMPLGAGNLYVVISALDADTGTLGPTADGDSWDVEYKVGLGSGAYWGIEINDKDNWDETRTQLFMGTTF